MDISIGPLSKEIYELMVEIEKLPASKQQTIVIMQTSELALRINEVEKDNHIEVDYINTKKYFKRKTISPTYEPIRNNRWITKCDIDGFQSRLVKSFYQNGNLINLTMYEDEISGLNFYS